MSTSPQDFPPLGSLAKPSLGSLAQSARKKSLNQARGLLVFIGVLTCAANVFMFFLVKEQVRAEVAKLQAQGQVVDPQAVDAVVRGSQLLTGGLVALGIIFIVLGLALKSYPVPITVTAFVLYVGAAVVMALLDPTTIASGWIIKIIVVAALVKAIQAAVAYQRESSASTTLEATA